MLLLLSLFGMIISADIELFSLCDILIYSLGILLSAICDVEPDILSTIFLSQKSLLISFVMSPVACSCLWLESPSNLCNSLKSFSKCGFRVAEASSLPSDCSQLKKYTEIISSRVCKKICIIFLIFTNLSLDVLSISKSVLIGLML